MTLFAGPRWESGRFVVGWVRVEAGVIAAVGEGDAPSTPDARGVLVPSFINAHTHVGDIVARGRIPDDISLAALVAPPDGLKHRILAGTPRDELVQGMRRALGEAHATGTSVIVDFREGGADGARALQEAASGASARAVVLGRPEEALPDSDGLGFSALRDGGIDRARAQRDAARRAGKRFALHWSEAERESAESLVELSPDFAVHATRASSEDLRVVAEARIPLVACPRSNARLLRELPDVRAWLDAGIDACLGSDNAMLQTVSMLDELRFARERLPRVTPEEILGMAIDAPRRRLAPVGAMRGWNEGEPADFVTLAPRGVDARAAVFAHDAHVLRWG